MIYLNKQRTLIMTINEWPCSDCRSSLSCFVCIRSWLTSTCVPNRLLVSSWGDNPLCNEKVSILVFTENKWRKEGNVLFNDALNTFYLRLYRVRHMVKDHSDSERGNPLTPHRLLFPIGSKGSFICTIP